MIYTSYFENIKNIRKEFPYIVFYSIAGCSPSFYINSKYVNYRTYPKLAPKLEWWEDWFEKFKENPNSNDSIKFYSEKYYDTVLSKLNIQDVVSELNNDNNICLLCYEKPDKFCHRQLVSEWFNKNGIKCVEILV